MDSAVEAMNSIAAEMAWIRIPSGPGMPLETGRFGGYFIQQSGRHTAQIGKKLGAWIFSGDRIIGRARFSPLARLMRFGVRWHTD